MLSTGKTSDLTCVLPFYITTPCFLRREKLKKLIAFGLLVFFIASTADAGPLKRLFGRRYRSNNSVSYSGGGNFGGSPQAVAVNKANFAASRGIKGHVGGGFGGGNAEGVGFSTYSAANALNNCCFTGQRKLAGSAVVRGRDGWYACKIFW